MFRNQNKVYFLKKKAILTLFILIIILLQGCYTDASSTTNTYQIVAIVLAVFTFILLGISIGSKKDFPKAHKYIVIFHFLIFIICILSFILSIKSYWKDKERNQLFMDSAVISSCSNLNLEFTKVDSVNLENPLIILKKVTIEIDKNNKEDRLALFYYSEGKEINENVFNNLKTVVIIDDVLDQRKEYSNRDSSVEIRVYKTVIEYFDLINKQYEKNEIKLDYTFPKETNKGYKYYVSDKVILETVKSKIIK